MTAGTLLSVFGPTLTGQPCDPYDPLGSCSALHRLVRTLQECGLRRIFLLTPAHKREELEKHMAHWGTLCLEVPENSSALYQLQLGLSALKGTCERALLLAADVPFLTKETIQALMEQEAPLCRPAVDGLGGGVACIRSALFPALQRLDPALSLAALPEHLGVPFVEIPVQDQGILADAKLRGLYPTLLSRSRKRPVNVSFKLRLCRERPFFGPGTVQLLSLIERTGSVRDACEQMGLSYSKGRKMISVMEAELEIPIVLRQQGGKNGGAARLTPEGKTLITRFEQLESRCQGLIQQAYREIFSAFP